jgi:hypothetical protein
MNNQHGFSAQQEVLEELFDDLIVRFFINLPDEELQSFERIFFQLEVV